MILRLSSGWLQLKFDLLLKIAMKIIPEVLIATGNKGKVREFERLTADLKLKIRSLSEFPNVIEVAETGQTFAENARLKAQGYGEQTGLLTLADDSGLEVAALDNAPGIFSARFGGDGLSDRQRVGKLLSDLDHTLDQERRARFICVIALAGQNGEIVSQATGVCEGRISAKPLGINGFGYDSVFIPDGFEKTFGELPASVKQQFSHRAQATLQIMRFLQDFLRI